MSESLKDYALKKTKGGKLIIDGMFEISQDTTQAGHVRQTSLTKLSEITAGKPLTMSPETKTPLKIEDLRAMWVKLQGLVKEIGKDMKNV